MQRPTLSLAVLLLAGCSKPEQGEQASIMDRIEKSVTLPSGAASLNQYKRYYARDAEGNVWAEFVRGPNRREWLPNRENFPKISDGGCGVVTVRHTVSTGRSQAWCNGVA